MITKNRSCYLQKDENRYASWLKIKKGGIGGIPGIYWRYIVEWI